MKARSWIARQLRTAVGTERIVGAINTAADSIRADLGHYLDRSASLAPAAAKEPLPQEADSKPTLEVLPGGPYQSVLMPLDYPPSRDFRPRWGYSRPPHQGLVSLFARRHAAYEQIVSELRALKPKLSDIPRTFTSETAPNPGWIGGPITALDSALVYYFVQKYKPATYLEIGSGVTTCFAKRAIQDHSLPTRVVSIDPAPRASIDAICDEVVRDGLETVDLAVFERLQPGDIVFLDGSHRSFMNSDVTVFMLDVLPLLKPGVVIHVHDILLPYDYPDSFKYWYWNEQYLLAVYLLAARDRIEVLMPSAYLTKTGGLNSCVSEPFVDLGAENDSWRHGGSMWFTHVRSAD